MSETKTIADQRPSPGTEVRGGADAATDTAATLPVIEEFVHLDRQTVDQGGYRLTKRVSTRDETVDESVRQQKVAIERRPIGRLLEGSELPQQRYEGDVLVIPVVEEVLVTVTRLRLVEEVRITRSESVQHNPQRVQLRREEISIERLEPGDPSGT